MDLSGKRALVTGASSGIGEALASALADEGVRLFLTGRHRERLEAVRKQAEHRSGAPAGAIPLDLGSDEAPIRLHDAAREALHGLDILVNNAGIGVTGPVAHIAPSDLETVFRVNVLAPHQLITLFWPDLKASKGAVVNVSSLAGQVPVPFIGGYGASKFALTALSRSLRIEAAQDGVRVILVHPNLTRTRFADSSLGRSEDGGQYPESMAVGPEVVARAIVRALKGTADEVYARPSDALMASGARHFSGLVTRAMARYMLRRDRR